MTFIVIAALIVLVIGLIPVFTLRKRTRPTKVEIRDLLESIWRNETLVPGRFNDVLIMVENNRKRRTWDNERISYGTYSRILHSLAQGVIHATTPERNKAVAIECIRELIEDGCEDFA